jgi:hypothetical protein
MPRLRKIVIYAAIVLVAYLVLSWLGKRLMPVYARHRVQHAVKNIEPWPSSTNYTEAGWARLTAAARIVQKTEPRLADEALVDYLAGFQQELNQLAIEQGKVFLLMRTVFDLPDHSTAGRLTFDNWARGNTDANPDGSVNLSWPLSWQQGQPRLVSGCSGSPGTYSVRNEYTFLRYHYKYRDLSH